MADEQGGGSPGGSQASAGGEDGNERLNDVLRQGIDTRRWAFSSLDGKAKAILTASTITLGVVMGGLGAGAGIAGGAVLPAWRLLEGIHPCLVPVVAFAVIASLALIFLAAHSSVRALRVFTMEGFGNAEAFLEADGERIRWGAVREWAGADSRHVHERVQEAHIREQASLKKQITLMGKHANRGQTFLLLGLLLSVAWGATLACAGIAASLEAAP